MKFLLLLLWFTIKGNAISLIKDIENPCVLLAFILKIIYLWVTKNINYDNPKAESVTSEYVSNVDETLNTKKGSVLTMPPLWWPCFAPKIFPQN